MNVHYEYEQCHKAPEKCYFGVTRPTLNFVKVFFTGGKKAIQIYDKDRSAQQVWRK